MGQPNLFSTFYLVDQMEPHTYSDQELLSDLFGFLPTRLTDRLYDIMNACVYNIFDGITEKLTSTRPDKEFEIAEVQQQQQRQQPQKKKEALYFVQLFSFFSNSVGTSFF